MITPKTNPKSEIRDPKEDRSPKSEWLMTLLLLACLCTGCAAIRPLKPGAALMKSEATGQAVFASEVKQPENPAHEARQQFERTTESELPLPAGTKVVERITRAADVKAGTPAQTTEKTIVLSEPVTEKRRTIEKAGTAVGAAQKDTAREIGAKLGSLRGVVWVGLLLFLAGLATLVYPPLRAIVGSVTTSVAMIVGGLALMVLPSLVVGHELLILSGVGVGVGGWFLAHRHGELRGKAPPGIVQPSPRTFND